MDSILEKASEKQQMLMPSFRRKLIPAWTVKEDPNPSLRCEEDEFLMQQTPCLYNGTEDVWGCCPFVTGICCSDHRTCCPMWLDSHQSIPMECAKTADGQAMCATKSSIMVRITLKIQ